MAEHHSYPTVLIAEISDEVRDRLIPNLRSLGYFVLEARSDAEALTVVRTHSRPIQVMVTNSSPDGRALASTVKQYRRQMLMVFVTVNSRGESSADSFSPDEAFIKIGELISAPGGPPETEEGARALRRSAVGYL